jgi:hypothetical protein
MAVVQQKLDEAGACSDATGKAVAGGRRPDSEDGQRQLIGALAGGSALAAVQGEFGSVTIQRLTGAPVLTGLPYEFDVASLPSRLPGPA